MSIQFYDLINFVEYIIIRETINFNVEVDHLGYVPHFYVDMQIFQING
jgi:hypothetical protein